MKSIASSPGKVILFGEHFVVYGVKAILASIDKRVTVTSSTIPENIISVRSQLGNANISTSKSSSGNSQLNPFFFLAKKMIGKFGHSSGIEIDIESEILPGIGLGSSSACCVAAAASLSGLFKKYSQEEIRNLAIEAEKTIFKDTSGADCTVCTYGGIIEYDKKSGFKKISDEANFHLVIANSSKSHSTENVVRKVKKFKEENEEVFSTLRLEESKLVEKANLALNNHNLFELGNCMNENQTYLESIGVSNEYLRSMIRTAKETSFGAKITGAGQGGCIISLVDNSNLDKTLKNLANNNYDCFSVKIDTEGLIQKPLKN